MDIIRVLIADDHTFFRDSLRRLLKLVPKVEVVRVAATGEETIRRAAILLQPRDRPPHDAILRSHPTKSLSNRSRSSLIASAKYST